MKPTAPDTQAPSSSQPALYSGTAEKECFIFAREKKDPERHTTQKIKRLVQKRSDVTHLTWRSLTTCLGFVGLSRITSFVFEVTAARRASKSVVSTRLRTE